MDPNGSNHHWLTRAVLLIYIHIYIYIIDNIGFYRIIMIYLKYHPNKLMNEYCQYINGLALAGLSISPTLKKHVTKSDRSTTKTTFFRTKLLYTPRGSSSPLGSQSPPWVKWGWQMASHGNGFVWNSCLLNLRLFIILFPIKTATPGAYTNHFQTQMFSSQKVGSGWNSTAFYHQIWSGSQPLMKAYV